MPSCLRRALAALVPLTGTLLLAGCESAEYPVVTVLLRGCGEPEGGWRPAVTYVLNDDIEVNPQARATCLEPTASTITIDGRGHEVRASLDPTGGRDGVAIRLRDSSQVRISNITISNFREAIDASGGSGLRIAGSRFRNNYQALRIAGMQDVEINQANEFRGGAPPTAYGIGIEFLGVENGRISGNTFSGFERAIRFQDVTESSVADNTLEDGTHGVVIDGGATHSVAHNTFRRAGGIVVSGVDADFGSRLTDNQIEAAGSGGDLLAAIEVADSRRISLRGNTISGGLASGVVLLRSWDCEVGGNTVRDNTNARHTAIGIGLVDADQASVRANEVSGNDFGIAGGGPQWPNVNRSEFDHFAGNRSCNNIVADLDCERLFSVELGSTNNVFGTLRQCLGPNSDPNWPREGADYERCQ